MVRVRAIWTALSFIGAVGLAGCAGTPSPSAPVPAGEATATAPRYDVQPVPIPPSFAAAVERGTRTLEGRPGPRYWQQRVSYRIDVELDPSTSMIQGAEEITYRNLSPDTLDAMVLHLYQNLFSQGVQRTRTVPVTGGMEIERVTVAGRDARSVGAGIGSVPGAAYQIEGTVMYVRLPRPLPPGDSVGLHIAWRFRVPPPGAPRMGRIDEVVYNIAQWYPQVAVYDDVEGWHTWPYLGNGEFYLEYGDFDVSITVPEGWLVAATGVLQNPDEVLTEVARERLRIAVSRDTIIQVVTADDFGPGRATQRAPGGQLTWRYVGTNVRDFAWATSNRYLWDATRAVLPDADGDGRDEVVPVHAFYRPEARAWREAARYTRHSLTFHAERWRPYIYPQMTSVEGPIGGMEYPMIVFVRAFPDPLTLYSVINHEVAHEWFPMMVGSKEPSYAWQDEGLGTYIENLATQDFFPDYSAFAEDMGRYLAFAGTEDETPMMRHADLFPSYGSFVVAAYSKPAVMLRALGAVIGEATLHDAIREYARRWTLRHPYPLDFFETVESVAGRDLDWFWYPWWYTTAVFDQAIAGVSVEGVSGGERVAVTVEDQGGAPLPIELALTLANGETRRAVVPVDVWLAGARRHTEVVDVPAQVVRVEIDPERVFPDVDRSDNVWERSATGAR